MADSGVATSGRRDSKANDLLCVKCAELLVNPMMLKCGHRICNGCIEKPAQGKDTIRCPNTEETCPDSKVSRIREDTWACKQIEKLNERQSAEEDIQLTAIARSSQTEETASKLGTNNVENSSLQVIQKVAGMKGAGVGSKEMTSGLRKRIASQEKKIHELQQSIGSTEKKMKTLESCLGTCASQADVDRQGRDIHELGSTVANAENRMNTISFRAGANGIRAVDDVVVNGQFLYRVTDFAKKKDQARRNNVLSWTSEAFLTSQDGYQMCVRVYLNGDGEAAGEYISVYLVLMEGADDDLQSWPFKKHITITLKAQNVNGDTSQDFVRQVTINPHLPGCQRPTGHMGPAFGIQKFIKITDMEIPTFLADDSVFIKVSVS